MDALDISNTKSKRPISTQIHDATLDEVNKALSSDSSAYNSNEFNTENKENESKSR